MAKLYKLYDLESEKHVLFVKNLHEAGTIAAERMGQTKGSKNCFFVVMRWLNPVTKKIFGMKIL